MTNTLSPLGSNELFGGGIAETAAADDTTFTCQECGHQLPFAYQHEEKSGVCFLDYVSEKDFERIQEAIAETQRMCG